MWVDEKPADQSLQISFQFAVQIHEFYVSTSSGDVEHSYYKLIKSNNNFILIQVFSQN